MKFSLKFLIVLIYNSNKVLCDTLTFITPNSNQIFNNPIINVDYTINRNGMLYISNTSTDLLDNTGQLLIASIFTNTILNPNIQTQVDTTTPISSLCYYTLRIIAYGVYNSTPPLYMTIQNNIPFSVDLRNFSNLLPNPVFNTPTNTINTLDTSNGLKNHIFNLHIIIGCLIYILF